VGHVDVEAVMVPLGVETRWLGLRRHHQQLGWQVAPSHTLSHVQAVAFTGKWDLGFSPIRGFAPARHRHRLRLRLGAPADETSAQWFGVTINFENTVGHGRAFTSLEFLSSRGCQCNASMAA
jgi:hypothetical protein